MSLPGPRLRGRHAPGLQTPDLETPGPEFPGQPTAESVEETGVAVDSTGDTTVGSVGDDRTTITGITVDADVSDFQFQIRVDGEGVFDAAKQHGGTGAEDFAVEADGAVTVGAGPATAVIDVTNQSGTNNATADVTVDAQSEGSY